MNRRNFIKAGALFVPTLLLPRKAGAIIGLPAVQYDLSDDFEETNTGGGLGTTTDGFDSPLVAVNTSGDQDYTAAPLLGAQSLRFNGTGVVKYITPSATEIDEFFLYKPMTLPGSQFIIWQCTDGSDNTQGAVYLYATGQLKIFNGSSGGSQTTAVMTAGTAYAVWAHWKSDGTARVAFAAYTGSQTRPTSGTFFDSVTGGNGTTACVRHHLSCTTIDSRFDHLRSLVGGLLIGDNP